MVAWLDRVGGFSRPRGDKMKGTQLPRGLTVPPTKRTLNELAALGGDIFDRRVRPALQPEDDGKFIAIDVETGAYVIDADDYHAVARLRAQNPAADIWLMRAGYPTTCRIGLRVFKVEEGTAEFVKSRGDGKTSTGCAGTAAGFYAELILPGRVAGG
jgi:hypothetical protein